MRFAQSSRGPSRRGTVLPLLGCCLIGLFAFTALAIDLGILAVSRTECQNGADISALIGCRTLNNKPSAVNNDLGLAVAAARNAATSNVHMSGNFTSTQVQKIEVGQFLYNATTQQFQVDTWYDVTNGQSPTPPAGSWTAIRVTIAFNQPTFFMKVMGVNSMPTGAVATAVYRPRDTAFVLDMTGSMAYASQFNYNNRSLNPDDLVPIFGHYVGTQTNLIATSNQANGSGEAMSRNNFTITTPGGLPIVRDFYYDPSNAATPSTSAYPVTIANLQNAFHRWNPSESGADPTTYTPPTYDFSGYNIATGPTPAPDSYKSMTDSGSNVYVGDRYRRADGSINKSDTTWATGAVTTRGAATAIDLLGYNVSAGNVRGGTSGSTVITSEFRFRDAVWEANGYDLNIVQYRTDKGNGSPMDPASYTAPLVPAADRFVGYSMGPGYWGKTFYIWPPDPRAPVNVPDQAGYVPGDWRRRYFLNRSGATLTPQIDNNPSTTGTNATDGINEVLFNGGSGQTMAGVGSNSNPNWRVDYSAVLRWIKSGPQTLPPNLRAGRVLYYTSIPDDVDTSSGSTEVKLDKVFWKNYIDYVLCWGTNNVSGSYLYGAGDSWTAGAARTITTSDMLTWQGPATSWPSSKPYMRYNDSPNRPRLHMWFGPLSMMDFLGRSSNWLPGTCHEAQCWQLKAGVNSAIDDVRNNRPNDYIGMVMFAASHYNGPRVAIGQDYIAMRNALFYPKSLLTSINGGDNTTEIRPYDLNFNSVSGDEIPNANGSTDPNTGLTYSFNILSPSVLTSTNAPTASPQGYGTVKGRRGATKVVIIETDGVPNYYRGSNSGSQSMNPVARGYDTYYPTSTWGASTGNGVEPCMSETIKVVRQIVKPMATQGNAQGSSADSGLSLPNAPARVYPVAFGDLFDVDLAPAATFRNTALQFLGNVAVAGNTGGLPSYQIITGPYDQRITRLKNCLERIFETGVSVALIE